MNHNLKLILAVLCALFLTGAAYGQNHKLPDGKGKAELIRGCTDCHTPHNLIGKYAVKASNGFFHSLYFTTGKYPDTIEITKFDRQVTEAACRRCHQAITDAIDAGGVHGKTQNIACTRCHFAVGHSDESAFLNLHELPGVRNHEQQPE